MNKLNKQHFNWFWILALGLIFLPNLVFAQGWEFIEEDIFEIPEDIIAPSQGGYLSVGTTILPGTGIVLKLDRYDLEGKSIFSKHYDVITPTAGTSSGYALNEMDNSFLISGPKIGYLKLANNGTMEWQYDVNHLNLPTDDVIVWSSIINDNSAYLVTQGSNNSISNAGLVKIDSDGNFLEHTTYDKSYHLYPRNSITTNDNGTAIICDYEDGMETGTAIIRTNESGEELWTGKYPNLTYQGRTLVEDENGLLYYVENSTGDSKIYRVNNTGIQSNWKTIDQDIILVAAKMQIDAAGDFVLTGHRDDNTQSKPTLMKFDADGNEVWTRLHQVQEEATIVTTVVDKQGWIISHGQYIKYDPVLETTAYRISIDQNGDIYDNFITGNVYSDNNGDCVFDTGDLPLSNWLIKADGDIDFYSVTDELGNYAIPVPVGTYTVSVSSPSIYYDSCTPSYSATATDQPETFTFDFGMQPDVLCPYLQVEVSVPILRFCYEQVYYVNYCNYGTQAATGASVNIVLDDLLSYVSAAPISPTVQANNTYIFDIPGTIDVGECGQFTITTQLTCEEDYVGSTACVEAEITPRCAEPISSTPHLKVEGFCDGDSIQFNILNIGDATLVDNKGFIVIEDNLVLSVGEIMEDIEPGEFISRRYMANDGATMNFLIEQELANFPTQLGDPYASATVEGCVGFPSEPYTYDNFYDDDGEVWFAHDCQEIVSSFDPNDKQVIPNGIDPEYHYILPNSTMEYKVRFQNTGTDTAFLVVIRDTISEHLDLTSFLPGTSSHPYRYEILNDGYLKFTFENILLPDSTTNEPASNGFVKYTIRQKPDLPVETVIENRAAIYFDFNSPVLTNTTWNTIGSLGDVGWVVSTEAIPNIDFEKVKVYPNPFTESVNFEIVSDQIDVLYNEKRFELYNSNGQLINSAFFAEPTYRFHKRNLPKGIYYYKIQQNGSAINAGKLIIQ